MDVLTTWPVAGVALVEINRPPNNFFDTELIRDLADVYEQLGSDDLTRVIVLASAGKHFCAGMDFSESSGRSADELYVQAARLIAAPLPVVAAIQGGAIGGGLGLALAADFRVGSSTSRFAANFAAIGLHPGFGLTLTLPRLVGPQVASELMYSGRRIGGAEAQQLGVCDRLVDVGTERTEAVRFAVEIATSAPLAVREIRATLRATLVKDFVAATAVEFAAQSRLFETADFEEGVLASTARRPPIFTGR